MTESSPRCFPTTLVLGSSSLDGDGGGDAALIVTAHPDDEALFFAPAILALRSHLRTIHLLCLSSGDFDGLGRVRRVELTHACRALGINSVRVVEDTELLDDPHAHWPAERVAAEVEREMADHAIRRVITFDESGVSGHANHAAVYRGVRLLMGRPPRQHDSCLRPPRIPLPSACVGYALRSTWRLRSFLGWLDVMPTLLGVLFRRLLPSMRGASELSAAPPLPVCCVNLLGLWQCHSAMRCHASQYVWFRRLYVLFSRYCVVNTLEPIN